MSNIEIMSPNQLKAAYAGEDGKGEFPAYTREEWREAVMHWSTEEGYWTWVHNCLCDESAEADAEEDMDIPVWAGVVPLGLRAGCPAPAAGCAGMERPGIPGCIVG